MLKLRTTWLTVIAAFLMLSACARQTGKHTSANVDLDPTVILVSLDGFRNDYIHKTDTPNLQRLAKKGVMAQGMIPAFPSKTFPNHYTIVTGLYPEHHGIVSNTMYDPDMDARFRISDRKAVEDSRWWGGEPVWVTAEKQGQISATYFWVGSEAEINGVRPHIWKRYDGDIPNRARVAEVLSWLDLPKAARPTLITLYFSAIDDAGHDFGPDAPEMLAAISAIDSVMGDLIQGLEKRDLFDQVNVIIVSDHGMSPTSAERVIYIDDYLDLQAVEVVDWSPILALRPQQNNEAEVYQKLAKAHPHLQVYRKAEIPERFQYRNHRRIMPIIGIADDGWSIRTRNRVRRFGGDHGYDNLLPSMRATFIAHGPAFKSGFVARTFQNIHVYDLICHLLRLTPAPNDGSLDSVRVLLKAK